MNPIQRSRKAHRSHLFTVRVWSEEMGNGQVEWRGKVQLLTNKDTRYFRNWTALASLLTTMLSGVENPSNDAE